MNSRESNQIGCGLFEHHWSKIQIRSGPCINYNKHISGSRPERRFESLRRRRDLTRGTVIVDHLPFIQTNLSLTCDKSFLSNHGTIAVLRYSPSRRSLLLSGINSRFRSYGSIRPSRYHAKRTRCVTINFSSKCHSFPESTDVRRFIPGLPHSANNFFLLVGHGWARSPWLANDR
jgi:hypothetical protein